MTGKEGGSQKKNSHHDHEHTKIMTCDYLLTRSSTSIKRPQPPFGHPKESCLCCYLYQAAMHQALDALILGLFQEQDE